jgi:hypothetical protein
MYAPGIQSLPLGGQTLTTGQSLGQGYANLGAGFAEWMKNDLQNNKMKAAVMGTIAQDPSILNQFTDQNTQKVLTKVRDGTAGAKDIAMAFGYVTAAKEQKQEALKNQMLATQNALLQQQQAAQAKAAADAATADQNIKLGGLASSNPAILNNDALKRGQAIASNPLFAVAQASKQLGVDPAVAERFLTSRYTPGGAPVEPFTYTSTDNQGNPIHVTIDKRTQRVIGTGPVVPAAGTPEMQAKTAGLVEQAKAQADDAQKFLTDVTDNAENARVRASSINRINALYDAGATSGFGQKQLTDIQAAMSRVGLAKKGLSDQQALNKELNNLVMETGRELMKGGGQVSNYERNLVTDATANAALDPAANRKILGVLAAVASRSVILDRKRQELDEKGFPPVEIARQLRKLRDSMPVGIEALGGVTVPPGWEVKQ